MSKSSPLRLTSGRRLPNLVHYILRATTRRAPRQLAFRMLKYLLWLLVLLNFKSWPIIWHVRLTPPIVRKLLQDYWRKLRIRLSPERIGRRIEDQWIDSLPLLGTNPFDYRDTFHTRATLDECDYNAHLSNSSYAKVLDIARIESVVRLFPLLWSCGAGMALGASYIHFIREIPAMQRFEIRSSIGSWDHKWVYIISKFVSKPRSTLTDTTRTTQHQLSGSQRRRTPTHVSRNSRSRSPSPGSSGSSSQTLNESFSPRSASSAPSNLFFESDGSLVYTVVVSQVCFKANRITIPPAIVLASNGFASPPIERSSSVAFPSHLSEIRISTPVPQDPSPKPIPDHWPAVKGIASPLYGGSMKSLYEFYRGGWQDLAQKDRWWDHALDGYVEVHRAAALSELGRLREGLDTARTL